MKTPPDLILTIDVSVYEDRMDLWCHTPRTDYQKVEAALRKVIAELTRIVEEGPEKCPHAMAGGEA